MSETVRNILVRDGLDYAEFFVRDTAAPQSDGTVRYAATLCCVSSYGVFGHHWSHMGLPFTEFAAKVDASYLLGKIARQVFDGRRFDKWIRREIFTSRASREDKRAALQAWNELQDEYSGEPLAMAAYHNAEISRVQPEWCDCDSRDYDPQAVFFVKKMWPKFVVKINEAVALSA